MKFTILACALMAVTSVAARPTPNQYGRELVARSVSSSSSRSTPSSTRREDNRSTSSSVTRTSSGSEPTRSNSNNNGNNNNNDNDREDDEDRNDNDRNDNNNNDRNRECKQQDIALASALGTSVVIGLGQQAAAEELLDNSNNNNNFNDKLDTLKQFVEAQATQVRTAATLIEDNNSAQNQVRELIDALDDQVDIINRLRNSNDDRQEIERLIDSFKDTTNLAQDGQAEALADCSIQLHVLV